MTATIKPPDKGPAERHGLRLSSMEILGFSDSSSMWSDAPTSAPPKSPRRGRHETTVADLQPQEFGGRLTGSNVRWGLVSLMVLLFVGVVGLGYWLYQRPIAQEQASLSQLNTRAADLETALPRLAQANEDLLAETPTGEASDLFEVESAARVLFETSGELGSSQTDTRAAASQASSSTLDAVRLATATGSYRAAVLPQLEAPVLETDPELIALDEAARQFGDWQLSFNEVRTALRGDVLTDVTEQLDILSGDLAAVLGRYVDALREDDMSAANSVVGDLDGRLADVREQLDSAVSDVQLRIDERIAEARAALGRIAGD